MVSSRNMAIVSVNPVSSLTCQELRVAIADEVFGWTNIRCESGGRILADHPSVMTTAPLVVPDWLGYNVHMDRLEKTIRNRGWGIDYRNQLNVIAGDFNLSPTRRQRCEAALLTARMSPMDRF
jgi:hypothetical protein